MQQPKMIVLGLISLGMRYGLEMEKFAEATNLRMWARIGASTIYKALKDLEKEGAIAAKREPSDRGPPRTAYSLTAKGKRQFRALVLDALRSEEPVYSDRVGGLMFAPLLPAAEAARAIENADSALGQADALLQAKQHENDGDRIAFAIIQYYRDVYAAERAAFARVRAILRA